MEDKLYKICICPVKNEAWIIERFIKATSLWADYIILADQNSSDATVEIAKAHSNVIVINNPGNYNEFERTKLLINEARKIGQRRLILALDADEFLSANYMESPEWQSLISMPPGNLGMIERVNISPETMNLNYFAPLQMIVALMDDNSASIENTSQSNIHNIRLPWPPGAKVLNLREVKVLHLDFVDYNRTKSKNRWYQCFEMLKNNLSPTELRDKYQLPYSVKDFLKTVTLTPINNSWIEGYQKLNIDLTSNIILGSYWWDEDVYNWIAEHGTSKFKLANIWEVNWVNKAKEKAHSKPDSFQLNRSIMDKAIFYLLYRKTAFTKTKIGGLVTRTLLFLS